MADDAEYERINQAVSAAETFSQLYYKKLDTERHSIDKFYHENATLAWNGNSVEGLADVKKFLLEKLPKSSFYIQSLDAQPVFEAAVSGQTTILVNVRGSFKSILLFSLLIQVAGTVKFGQERTNSFQQNFLLTATKDSKWKIVTDIFRSQ